jgi:lipopolysaccharide transport system permease protein
MADQAHAGRLPLRTIEPRRAGIRERLAEAGRHYRLIPFFGRRFVERMYLRTWLGWLWIPLRPVLDVAARLFVFGGLFGAASEGVPYVLYLLIGMSAWELFERTTYWSTRSLEVNRRFVRRIYVPRLTILAAAIFPSGVSYLVYLGIAFVAFAGYLIADGHLYLYFGLDTLAAPAGMALLMLLGLSLGCWLSIYGAQARDIRFWLSYVLSFWFFVTPIVLPLSEIPSGFREIVQLNPVTAPVLMVKHGLLGTAGVPLMSLVSMTLFLVIVGGVGLWFFSRSEDAAVEQL